MKPTELRVISIKCRFRCLPFRFDLKNWKSNDPSVQVKKRGSNFISIRAPCYTYVAFSSGDVNVVRVRTREEAHKAKAYFLSLFEGKIEERPRWKGVVAVDNIALTTKLRSGGISDFFNFLETVARELKIEEFGFNPRRFSGSCLKTAFGTAIVFSSGSINFLGVRSFQDIPLVEKWLQEVEGIRKLHGY